MLINLVPFSVEWCIKKNHVLKKDLYNAKDKNIKGKIPKITNSASNTILKAKANEVKKQG